jgi:hypothetical protein
VQNYFRSYYDCLSFFPPPTRYPLPSIEFTLERGSVALVSTPNVWYTLWWGPCAKGHFIHAGPPDPEFFFFFFFISVLLLLYFSSSSSLFQFFFFFISGHCEILINFLLILYSHNTSFEPTIDIASQFNV